MVIWLITVSVYAILTIAIAGTCFAVTKRHENETGILELKMGWLLLSGWKRILDCQRNFRDWRVALSPSILPSLTRLVVATSLEAGL